MYKKIFAIFLVFLSSYSYSQEFSYGENQEIVVTLPSKAPLLSVAIFPIFDQGTTLSPTQLNKLYKALSFDFNHNGYTKTSTLTPEMLKSESHDLQSFNQNQWRDQKIYYVIKGNVKDNLLTFALYSSPDEKIRTTMPVKLTGDEVHDRQAIHKVADSFFYTLFKEKGIASSKIIYTVRKKSASEKNTWVSEVYQSDYDGHNKVQLTNEGAYIVTPTTFPKLEGIKNNYFFYVSYQTGQPKIYISNTDNPSFKKRLTSLRGNQFMPVMSPRGDKIAFICDAGGRADLFLLGFDPNSGPVGKPYQIFSAPQATQASPSFSPNGDRIVFVSDKSGTPRVYVMQVPPPGTKLNELKLELVSKRNTESTSPSWSPDGKKIAFSSKIDGVRQIWVYDTETGKERQVTSGNKHKENPTWANNSKHLIFNTADAYFSELFLLNLNDAEAIQITSGYGEKRFPHWQNI
ncbi:MAG: Tol-Pal system protein TolB [Chlamydiales bacterium]|nr:Tol-Pal system protein TolB [Chlamydiales bacterium]NCF70882.1 Tol-Pal system protein TolB [Chlamydiales bacterium]